MHEAFTIEQLPQSWQEQLKDEWSRPYWSQLLAFLKSEYARTTVYPKKE